MTDLNQGLEMKTATVFLDHDTTMRIYNGTIGKKDLRTVLARAYWTGHPDVIHDWTTDAPIKKGIVTVKIKNR